MVHKVAMYALAAALCSGLFAGTQVIASSPDAVSAAIRSALTAEPGASPAGERPLEQVYAARGYAGLWLRGQQLTSQGNQLLELLARAGDLGLDPADYDVESLGAASRRLASQPAPAQAAAVDLGLTASALRYVHDAHFGRIDPKTVGFELDVARAPFDAPSVVLGLSRSDSVAASAASIEPQFYHYALLKQALHAYRDLARSPPPLLDALTRTVKEGDAYAQAPALRQLLERLGDLPSSDGGSADALVFDASLSEGVRRFQARHGLEVDGALGRSTVEALRTPLAQRVRQIELTLERWRWVPEFSAPPLIVNIPQFRLFAFRSLQDRKADILQMDVIVGRAFPSAHTPVFMAQLSSVIFRPYWQVPQSIVRKEMIPKLMQRPGYLDAEHLQIVARSDEVSPALAATPANISALASGALKLRQSPGADNALGLVKFSLPNPHDVYLHSTPTPALFSQPVRAFSHGCIRVSDPVALAVHVLRDTPGDWSAERVRGAMQGSRTLHVKLAHTIPVLILYGTALATEDGKILFFRDIYGHDRKLAALLHL